VYGLAYKFFEFPLVFPTFFMNAVYPFMVQSQVSESRYLNLWRITKKSLIILLGISLLFVIGFWIAAPLLTLIREDFSASIEPFRILILGLPLFFVSSVFMWVLVTVGKQRLLLVLYGGSMIVNAVLNYLFIPRFSYLAAAWITLVSEALVVVASGFAVWQLFKGRQQESA
jgi:O-antigen/teichoic acid export membrane protein